MFHFCKMKVQNIHKMYKILNYVVMFFSLNKHSKIVWIYIFLNIKPHYCMLLEKFLKYTPTIKYFC